MAKTKLEIFKEQRAGLESAAAKRRAAGLPTDGVQAMADSLAEKIKDLESKPGPSAEKKP